MIKIRPGTKDDENFILATWLNGYMNSGNWFYKPSNKIYYPGQEAKIKSILQTSQTHIVTSPEDETQIIGYLVQDLETVHFCYIKNLFRKMGIAKELMKVAKGRKYYSQHTAYSKHISKGLQYDPYRF